MHAPQAGREECRAMAEEEKKSFLLYTDRWKEIQMLSNEQCGILFKAVFTYVNTGVRLETDDLTLQVLFSVLTSQIDEGTRRWEATRKARSEAGKKSGESRRNKQTGTKRTNVQSVEQKQTKANKDKQTGTKRTVTVTGTVTDTVTVPENIPQDSTALERAALPAPGEEEVIPWDEIDFELV